MKTPKSRHLYIFKIAPKVHPEELKAIKGIMKVSFGHKYMLQGPYGMHTMAFGGHHKPKIDFLGKI